MTHLDRGHYAKKHPDTDINLEAKTLLKAEAKDGKVTCVAVHRIAKELGITPADAGVQVDLLELRLIRCSLGLFGYGKGVKMTQPVDSISEDLENLLDQASDDGRISCHDCWRIAKQLKISRIEVSSACELKKLKIRPCQLGAF
jgi:hypothetical protein